MYSWLSPAPSLTLTSRMIRKPHFGRLLAEYRYGSNDLLQFGTGLEPTTAQGVRSPTFGERSGDVRSVPCLPMCWTHGPVPLGCAVVPGRDPNRCSAGPVCRVEMISRLA
jgi:hypothetical protein